MARLNNTEKLIQHAAKRLTPFESKLFDKLTDFFDSLDFLYGSNDIEVIIALYCKNHGTTPFEIIAGELGTSVSRLESKRKDYQKMFLYFGNKLKAEGILIA